jgi:hypothetical protein
MNWNPLLSPWLWAPLLAVPPAVIMLYFLKLKRQPLEVPSTYLWLKSIEDLHVNSLWQRLRQSLLLFLQLLILLIAILALLNPTWQEQKLSGNHLIFLVDNSASMGTTDVGPNRLEEAKRQISALIDEMSSDSEAMIISFSDDAQVEQNFTSSRRQLRERLDAIQLTNRPTSLAEALQVASGLANPGQASFDSNDAQVAEPIPAALYIFSDGRFPDVNNFSLGNLDPVKYVPIGEPDTANIGIVSFTTERGDKPDQLQAFARLENFGSTPAKVELTLLREGNLIDATQLEIEPGSSKAAAFELGETEPGALELRVATGDKLAIDDVAFATINPPQRSKVLLITPGNEPLQFALATSRAEQVVELTVEPPEYLKTDKYRTEATTGAYDLIVYDRCVPVDAKEPNKPGEMPQSNTLFVGTLPPGDLWKADAKVDVPQIIDTDRSHPLMNLIEMGNVLIYEGTPLKPPPGSTVLIDTNAGPLFAIGPREGFEDAVLGFEIVGDGHYRTNWWFQQGFPVFAMNLVNYLGSRQVESIGGSTQPGEAVALRSLVKPDKITVETPNKKRMLVPRGRQNLYTFHDTGALGVYRVLEADTETQRFAVNLFDAAESDVRTQPDRKLKIGHTDIQGESGWEVSRRDGWKWLVLIALGVLLFEWYIYNRRVYL